SSLLSFFFFSCYCPHRHLHSFPTRRSSDLARRAHLRAVLQWRSRHRPRAVPRPRAGADERRDSALRAAARRRQCLQTGIRRPAPVGDLMNEAAPSPRGASDRPVVLVVDDEPDLLELVSLTLSRMNLTTRTASDLNGARRLLKAERFDLCLTDMRLPDGDGLDLVAWIQENKASVPVAVITAHGYVESAVRALKLGAFDFVSKP